MAIWIQVLEDDGFIEVVRSKEKDEKGYNKPNKYRILV